MDFVGAALGFPAVVFSFALLVVIGYWVLVMLGGLGIDALGHGGHGDGGGLDGVGHGGHFGGDGHFDGGHGGDTGGDHGDHDDHGLMHSLGFSGVPVTVVLSLLIAVAWFVSLAGAVLLDRIDAAGPVQALLAIAVLVVALVCAWAVARVLVLPLRRLALTGPEASRSDFVGRICVIRTGRVDARFGQAEVTAADGSSAIVQVRQTGDESLSAGSIAIIFDYDADGEFFWVAAAPRGLE